MTHKFIYTIFFLLFISAGLYAQHTENFEITLAEGKVSNSLYNRVKVLDSRLDTSNLGIIQTGAFNRKTKVIPEIPLSRQFSGLLNSLIDQTAQQGELLLQLRQCSFAETTGGMSEKGYFYFRAMLYSKKEEQYQKIGMLDTVILMKSSIDVTRGLLRNGSKIMGGFLGNHLLTKAADSVLYTYRDVLSIDSIEKSKIKIYSNATLKDGMYSTYKSFMDQKPDQKIQVEGEMVEKGKVKVTGEDGKLRKIQYDAVYSIVYKGQPYVVTKYGYYPLEKKGNDFLFTGKAQVTANTASVITASVFFGVLGGLIASNDSSTFEMKIDHLNGGFIRLKEIPNTITTY